MNYCILRAKKLKNFGSVVGSAKHTFREIPTPNADPTRTHLNETIGAQNAAAVYTAIEKRLPAKRRQDAVLAIEYLVTASPEWFRSTLEKQQTAYFNAALRWLEARHGKANIVCVDLQKDETSPHLVAYVVPLTKDGRLSAKEFLGGRKLLSEMQTDFAEKIGKPIGLQRGVEGSKAAHTTAKQYNAALQKNPTLTPPTPPVPTVTDRITGKAKQMAEEYAAALVEHAALVEQARNVAEVSRRAREEQAAALKRMRAELTEVKRKVAETELLRKENELLKQRDKEKEQAFAAERQSLMETIAGLKEHLTGACAEIERMAARIFEDRLLSSAQDMYATEEIETPSPFKP